MENKIMEAMSCLEPRLIQEAAQPRTHKRPNIRQVLLVACLCALIAIPVFALVSGWVVEKLPGSDSSLQAEPGLTGADFTEQQKARFRAFVREWGTKGTFSGISQMKGSGQDFFFCTTKKSLLHLQSGISLNILFHKNYNVFISLL